MAMNDNPYFSPGRNIDPDQLRLWIESLVGAGYDPQQGKFGPSLSRTPILQDVGVGDASSQIDTGRTEDYIYQPRNVSTWGGNDVADVWDRQGNYLGASSGATDLRSLARLAGTAAAGYYGAQYLNGAGGASAAGGTAPTTATLGADAMAVQFPALTEAGLGSIPATMTAEEAAALGLSGAGSGLGGGAGAGTGAGSGGGSATSLDGLDAAALDSGAGPTNVGAGGWGGNMNWMDLAKLAMGIYGASQSRNGQTTQTSSQTREPWAPAAPYLLNQLAQGAKLQEQYAAQPFTDLQRGAINQRIGLLSGLNQQVLPGLLSSLSGVTAGYQRPGGPAPRAGFNFDPQGLLGQMNSGIDWTRRD